MTKFFFFIACLSIAFSSNAQNSSFDALLNSIQRLRKLTKNKNSDLDIRLKHAKLASELSYKTGIDSTIILSNARVAHIYLLNNNYEHVKLNNNLLNAKRASRNKFTRLQYETDNYIDETKRLAFQNILIFVIGHIIILIFILIFIIRIQITKNKILHFESEQQKANEEIYTLMLRQQTKVEEGRLLERHRISEELHDGILNKLLGSRLGLEFLSLDEEDESKEKYSFYINEIQSVEREIRDLSHELRHTQLDADKDFITILEDYIGHQSNLHTCQYNINQNGSIFWEDINDYIKVGLYRIIQEALQNIIKHAKANTVTINFSSNSNKLYLDIIDDGVGFNSNQKNDGIGLLNIASRVSKLKGEFKIKSEIRIGTVLAIKVPLF